jgi:hypothetical protein
MEKVYNSKANKYKYYNVGCHDPFSNPVLQ